MTRAAGDPAAESTPDRFRTTRWTLIHDGAGLDLAARQAALEAIARDYWYPLYACLRRRGFGAEDAADSVQALFLRLIEPGALQAVDRKRGRFRSWLLTAALHQAADDVDARRALKRRPDGGIVRFDASHAESRFATEPAMSLPPDRLFDRQWALAVIERALERLRAESAARGAGAVFARLESGLVTGDRFAELAAAATDLDMTQGAVKVALHRLRRRFAELVREAVASTVATDADVEDEIRGLLASLS